MLERLPTWSPPFGVTFSDRLEVAGVQIRVRELASFDWDGGSARSKRVQVFYNSVGVFYGVERIRDDERAAVLAETIVELMPDRALLFILSRFFRDDPFRTFLCEQFQHPDFGFMSEVPVAPKAKRQRKPKAKPGRPFYVQLNMATNLVEVVRQLDAASTIERLSAACRAVSQLHQAMHLPDNFKSASAL